MIRRVKLDDAKAITEIYNKYIVGTTISFETKPLDVQEMAKRIEDIWTNHPYLVYETDNGEVVGYCYVHQWKERAAYCLSVETTVYCSQSHLKRS